MPPTALRLATTFSRLSARRFRTRWLSLPFLGLGAVVWSCGGGDGHATAEPPGVGGSSADAGTGGTGAQDASTGGTGGFIDTDAHSPDADSCAGQTCANGFRCRYDTCVPDLGTCATHDDCPGDSYCDATGECIPYGVPTGVDHDPACVRPDPPPGVLPVVQCEWASPADPSDPSYSSVSVYTSPIVADLNLDNDPGKLQPSVIITTWESTAQGRIGTLRIFDGRTCEEQLRIGGTEEPTDENRPAYGTQWAVGDLDGDVGSGGRPEIVGLHRTTGSTNDAPLNLYAIALDSTGGQVSSHRLWYGRDCTTDTPVAFASNLANYGPGIWDLDDDGSPEVVLDQMVFDSQGCLHGPVTDFNYIEHRPMVAVADADLDGKPELIRFDRVAQWDPIGNQWMDEAWFVKNAAAHKPGHVAIADLGQYSEIPGKPAPNTLPEVVVVSAASNTFDPTTSGSIRVQALDGSIVWGPIPLYSDAGTPGGHGGPPTASDFDGDGQVEFAAAANQYYVVYDPDCVASLAGASPAQRPGGKCDRDASMQGLPDGILWAQPSQDFSSSGTGSSVFDFDGNGQAEAVYGDECYVRVYNGSSGEVLFSAPASNGTGFEFPTVVDVDGDFATEIVVARGTNSPACPATDPLFPASDTFAEKGGFVVLRDPEDRWASSRPIWNQHAYSVTNVEDDGRIPRSSDVLVNWTTPGLNNFRQNVQGDLGVLHVADLTVVLTDLGDLCAGKSGTSDLVARVCNRGTNPVQDGVVVEFYEADVDAGAPGTLVCSAQTTKLLLPGECEEVGCTGDLSGNKNVSVTVDPNGGIADCHPGNNNGAGTLQLCPAVR